VIQTTKYRDAHLLTIDSVIHGKTGTGKSLLLAAIIGEANILEGDVQVPRAPPMHMRGNENASLEDWIIPSAVAYVGQVPWIENTSIKNTVLFGLPYHHERYMQVSQPRGFMDSRNCVVFIGDTLLTCNHHIGPCF
jgi:ABC-type transport system involved in cytochrome bd biosynthesis fused ATPase/permease subunit